MTALQMIDMMRRQMIEEMAANVCKGDKWCEADPEALEYELLYHAVKLIWAGRSKDTDGVREYAADVANHAGMLADRLGALKRTAAGNASAYLAGSSEARDLGERLCRLIVDPPAWLSLRESDKELP